MSEKLELSLREGLAQVPEPREARGQRHPLAAILALAVDSKALRGWHGDKLTGVCLVAAYAGQAGLVVGQKGGQGAAQVQ